MEMHTVMHLVTAFACAMPLSSKSFYSDEIHDDIRKLASWKITGHVDILQALKGYKQVGLFEYYTFLNYVQ